MKIVHIASEVQPFFRVGGLSNVLLNLPRALAREGEDIYVFSPLYLNINCGLYDIQPLGYVTSIQSSDGTFDFEAYGTEIEGVKYRFLYNREFFARRGIYGSAGFDYSDNDKRFATFCQACLNYISDNIEDADVINCHDWQTALIPVYMKKLFGHLKAKSILTIHDIAHHGIFCKFSIDGLNLGWEMYNIEELEFFDNISFLKGGIVYSDWITTVSPTYAREISNTEFAGPLNGIMKANSHKIRGILNGINVKQWNPATGHLLDCHYSAGDISGKEANKAAVCESLGLDKDKPLIAMIGRYAPKNGTELILQAVEELAKTDANYIFLGYGDGRYALSMKKSAKEHDNITVKTGYNESFSHELYAAADFILVPSLYQPCGDSHLVGMRYGAIPIATATGGNNDTVKDIQDGGQGFIIREYNRASLIDTINRAIAFTNDKDKHKDYVKLVMKNNYSWSKTAEEYIQLYRDISGGNI